jgi:hypothetical protein
MIISTIAGTMYGFIFSFLNNFLIVITNNLNHPYNHLFNSCNIQTSILFSSYAYDYIMRQYGWIFLQQHKSTALEMVLYFGFIFPTLIVYPSEFTCGLYNQRADFMIQKIITSPAVMIFTTLMLESSGIHNELVRMYYQ